MYHAGTIARSPCFHKHEDSPKQLVGRRANLHVQLAAGRKRNTTACRSRNNAALVTLKSKFASWPTHPKCPHAWPPAHAIGGRWIEPAHGRSWCALLRSDGVACVAQHDHGKNAHTPILNEPVGWRLNATWPGTGRRSHEGNNEECIRCAAPIASADLPAVAQPNGVAPTHHLRRKVVKRSPGAMPPSNTAPAWGWDT